MTSRFSLRWLQAALVVLGSFLLGLWLQHDREARVFQKRESQKLERALQEAEASRAEEIGSTRPRTSLGPGKRGRSSRRVRSSAPVPEQGILGRIEVPRLGISAIIAEGTTPELLRRAVGHVSSTSLPGKPGNVGLAGHRDTFLRKLEGVREDDVIRIVTLRGSYVYRVKWRRVVAPHRIDLLDATAAPSLTLITCYPFQMVGPAPMRFVVRAKQVRSGAALAQEIQAHASSLKNLPVPEAGAHRSEVPAVPRASHVASLPAMR